MTNSIVGFAMNRKTKCLLLLIAVMCIHTYTVTSIVINHDLHWEVDSGDRFYFSMNYRETSSVSVYMEIVELPSIPQDQNSLERNFPVPVCRTCFDNGTEFHPSGWFSYWQAAIPIGNWSFLEDIVTSQDSAVDIIETDEKWGKRVYTPHLGILELMWYKMDGSLSNYSNWSTGVPLSFIRVDAPETPVLDNLQTFLSNLIMQQLGMLVIGGSFGVITLMTLLTIQERRKYNELCRIEELEHKQTLACLLELTKIEKNEEKSSSELTENLN